MSQDATSRGLGQAIVRHLQSEAALIGSDPSRADDVEALQGVQILI